MSRRFPYLGLLLAGAGLAAVSGCARGRTAAVVAPALTSAPRIEAVAAPSPFCVGCSETPASDEIARALAARVADLKARGGVCQAYAAVLEGSLATGRIVVRPFMWRIGTRLASAQATSTGAIDVAREIDPLNVGVRSLDDVLHSVEHEAAHIAFAIPSGQEWTETLVNERVGGCRAQRN